MSKRVGSAKTAEDRCKLREKLAARDGRRCFYCRAPFVKLHGQATFDHYVPRCLGGTGRQRNIVLACRPCNQAKADRLPVTLAALLLRRVREHELWWRACMPASVLEYAELYGEAA